MELDKQMAVVGGWMRYLLWRVSENFQPIFCVRLMPEDLGKELDMSIAIARTTSFLILSKLWNGIEEEESCWVARETEMICDLVGLPLFFCDAEFWICELK
jgi:hypothetical protein